ncbi:MAG: phospho-N-acetylmuramoyl-pentapeptide-transferase [Bdellovibrionaceae bacterium]|nr:phospho-N-acetylmuramoyl-pentapeptide-transferase [Pseudobdellovibrionaceae bacterium]
MIYKLLFEFSSHFPIFNLFQYITFRSFLAFFTSFFICLFLSYFFIKNINGWGERINTDGPSSHQKKKGTPTMGGSFILLSLLPVCLLWIDLSETLVIASLVLVYGFALIGLWDDLLKLKKENCSGMKVRWRILLELSLSCLVLFYLSYQGYISTEMHFPFLKDFSLDIGWAYILFGAFVITGCANAVNLTDGLDGLAIFPVMICAGTLCILSYLAGHYELAEYLNIPFIMGAGELVPLSASIVACCLGFLWYNSYPAQVFMGDVGSLGLGSFLGITAVLTKNEFLLVILGGIFVAEALSVIFQVLSYKLTKKRIFKMTPLHHHFELNGIAESKIIVRFWIISILLAVFSLAALKIR